MDSYIEPDQTRPIYLALIHLKSLPNNPRQFPQFAVKCIMKNSYNKLAILLNAEILYAMLLIISQSALFVKTLKIKFSPGFSTRNRTVFPKQLVCFYFTDINLKTDVSSLCFSNSKPNSGSTSNYLGCIFPVPIYPQLSFIFLNIFFLHLYFLTL